MNSRTILKFILGLLVISLAAPLALPHTPADAQSGPCSQHPDNLIQNGSMLAESGHLTQYGEVAGNWEPFVLSGTPRFSLETNENANGDIRSAAQHIFSDQHPFDAGIYQVVSNIQAGVYYSARVGQAMAAVDYGDGKNVRNGDTGRRVGVDPFGGTDPNSPNVIWGNEFHDLMPALNIPALTILVAARSNHMTVFARATDHNSSGLSKIWFDVICLKPDFSQPTATPLPATATPLPSAPPTRPPATRPPATRIAQGPTATNTPVPATPTSTNTPTPRSSPTSSATPRYARPDVTPIASLPVDPGTGAMTGLGLMFVFIGFISFGIGILLWIRQTQPERSFRAEQEIPALWQ